MSNKPTEPPSDPNEQAEAEAVVAAFNRDEVLADPMALKGKPFDETAVLLNQSKIAWRVVMMDGRSTIVTRDYRPDRLNLVVDEDKIVGVGLG